MSNKPFLPAGKLIVVTGGASGIGAALCRAFAKGGASTIVVADINLPQAERMCRKLSESCGASTDNNATTRSAICIATKVDVASDDDVKRLIEWVERTIGPIDMFVCNAGVMLPRSNPELNGDMVRKGEFASDAEWRRVMNINTMQLVSAARYLIPKFLQRQGGHILITASAAGFCPIGSASYCASKGAAVNFGEWLSVTYGSRGVGVCLLCPQRTRSEMTKGFTGDNAKWLGRMIEADDVALCAMEALREGRLLALPHQEVQDFLERKAKDADRWMRGMRRLSDSIQYTSSYDENTVVTHLSKL